MKRLLIAIIIFSFPAKVVFSQQADSACYLEFKKIRDRYLKLDDYSLELIYSMKGGDLGDKSETSEISIKKSGTNLYCKLPDTEIISTNEVIVTVSHDKKLIVLSKPQEKIPGVMEAMNSSIFSSFTEGLQCNVNTLSFRSKGEEVSDVSISYSGTNHSIKHVNVTYKNGDESKKALTLKMSYVSEKTNVTFSNSQFNVGRYYRLKDGKFVPSLTYEAYQLIDLTYNLKGL